MESENLNFFLDFARGWVQILSAAQFFLPDRFV
jgi:hypothetical protein